MLLKSNSTKLELQLQLLPRSKIMYGNTGDRTIFKLSTLRLNRAKWVWVGGNFLQHSERSENLK